MLGISIAGILVNLLLVAACLGALYLVIRAAVLAALTQHSERLERRRAASEGVPHREG